MIGCKLCLDVHFEKKIEEKEPWEEYWKEWKARVAMSFELIHWQT